MTSQVREPCTKCFRRDSTIYVADLCDIRLEDWPESPRICKSCSYELGGSLAYLRFYGIGSTRQLELLTPDVQARAERAHAKLMADARAQPTADVSPPTPPASQAEMVDLETGEVVEASDGIPNDVTAAEVSKTRSEAKRRA